MRREFKLPDVGEGLTEAEIVRWHVKAGDTVKVNQIVVEIETAKSIVELPIPWDGVVAGLMAEEGDTVDVGLPIIAVDTAEDGAPSTPAGGGAPSEATSAEGVPSGAGTPARASADPAALADDMVPRPPAEGAVEPGAHGSPAPKEERQAVLVGYGVKTGATKRRPRKQPSRGIPANPVANPSRVEVDGPPTPPGAAGAPAPAAVTGAPAPAAPAAAGAGAQAQAAPALAAAPGAGSAGRGTAEPGATRTTPSRIAVLAKPPVRKLAKDLGVDLATITGTGPQGSITRDDVHAAAQQPQAQEPQAQEPTPVREERIPVKGVRKATAQAMVGSAFTAPHVTEFLQVDMTQTMEAVRRLRTMPDFAEVKVSPLLLVARAVLTAVGRHPAINASWAEETQEIVIKHYVNLGIAAATPRGLLVPNIKNAQDLSLPDLAKELAALTETARAGRTQPAEMSGGTFTITNVGVFGVDGGTPIINPGEAAILAVGQVRDMPWVVDGELAVRKVATLSLSFDHRMVDGELGSLFLADVGAMLEDPLRMLAWS
ncbi:Dihydrolipoamide acetyltransferase component of pyruvate dehydrogenase complex [[Actinomadura] parvosata subsp. kistnae]|uniref:Dihydrolipoamide acetyltransferase component of pyruvate dehydrogenase complex n=1 Tax=[Actinomadura] parvosata subsp. kistnae TaxID=1909395 RepID=A0A1V0ADN8_9ACTN|nr:2-oxo acid dehydrogenase subunit E2 [Nonomuraea sp. ATCC 55076]AQZ68306.1 branched-chain alpha-keto acid dehydrogenase subunit E2 [Nonomuraea sp. ATCC 55076]SPL93273.1 Dihydrolipoamide acetyltransferase component of pyruvate dehydrogenase complex [Actinomadura parvosata subsp. kistnae]